MIFDKISPLYVLLIYIAVMSVITFFAYGIDKLKAKHKSWRISEKTLLWLGGLGGALGGLIGMNVWRHKTKHRYFWAINAMALACQIILILALARR